MPQLALYLFGTPRLELDGNPVHIPRRKATALLAYLTVSGQSHSRDALATLLWSGNDQSSARAELRRTLSVLNRTLGDGWLTTDRETASLNTQKNQTTGRSFWLDAAAFQGKLKVCESHNHPPTVTCPDCLPTLEEAVELYSDDFMAGFSLKDCPAYDEWQFFQGEELRTKLTNVLVRLSSHYANVLEYEVAIVHARRWLALDPLHELAYRQLISLFSQSGQRAAALRQYETCRQTLDDELGVEPSEETKDLYQEIQGSTLLSAAASRPKSNLPAQATPFIGRVNELAEIRGKLKEADCRLLTLLGSGGSGKTRLAIEAAERLLDEYKHGVFFVNLAPLEDAERIPTTIAGALNFSFYEGGTPEEQLLDYLGNKQMLLILDNFEHLLGGVGLVNQILYEAPDFKILATSRVRLMVTSEHIFNVWGMAYPESTVSVKLASHQFSAIKLFESQASRVQGNFKLTDDNLGDVIQICALLEGIPLGILLAASWVTMLTPAEIAEEIARDLAFLEKELQDLPQRQRSLRSVFNHSWRLLSDREQKILSALSVFRGGFRRDAAAEVVGVSLAGLMGLIDKSILHRGADGRFEVHELLRQYAAEKLECDPATEEDIRSKHSDYFCRALGDWEHKLQGPQQAEALVEMRIEIDNIRTAWTWALGKTRYQQMLSAINGLCMFYYRNYQRSEGVEMIRTLLEEIEVVGIFDESKQDFRRARSKQIDHILLLARALCWGGLLNQKLGRINVSNQYIQSCLSLLKLNEMVEWDTRFERAFALLVWSETRQQIEDSLRLFKSLNEPWWTGFALYELGKKTNSLDESLSIIEECLSVRRKHGDLWGIASSLVAKNFIIRYQAYRAMFFSEKAEMLLYEALDIYSKLNDRQRIVYTYGQIGSYWVHQGKFHQARSLERDILAAYHDLGYSQSQGALTHAVAGYPDQYLGSYEDARNQAKQALQLLQDVKHSGAVFWIATAIEILARVDLAEGSYLDAEERFQKSIATFRSYGYESHWNLSQTVALSGYAARGLGQTSLAKGRLREALKIVVEGRFFLILVHILPGIALLFADQGEVERAVELYALASTQGIVANSKWFDDIAGDEIARAAEGLPAEVVEAAKARGRSLDLWGTAKELLVDLTSTVSSEA